MKDSPQTAAELDWNLIPRFSPGEFPPGVLTRMDPSVILTLSDIRNALPATHRINPSPVPGAHVRDRGTIRHGTNHGKRLSNATDFFMDWGHAWAAWQIMLANPNVGGLGIYPDMLWNGQPGSRCMFHIDTMPDRMVWVGWRLTPTDSTRYVYMHHDPIRFHKIIAERAKQ